jgi:hypothetical protein
MNGHIIEDGVVGPGHQTNLPPGTWFPIPPSQVSGSGARIGFRQGASDLSAPR